MTQRKKTQKAGDDTLVDIVEVREQAQSFIDRNQNLVLGALLGLVVIVGGVFAYKNFLQKPRQQEAVEQMYQAQTQFERDSFALALTNPGGGFLGFLDVIDKYSGTKAANLSHYYAGISYLNLGQYEAAIDYLKDFNAKGEITPMMKFGAIADAYSELQDFDKALQYYKRAIDAGDNDAIVPYYLKKVGMLYERQSNFAKAKEAYQRIKDDYSNTVYGQDIDKYLIRVSRQG